MRYDFEGKVALVTGGNSGIGRATANLFARNGARVAIAARRIKEGEQVVAEIKDAGGEAIFIPTDVSQADQVEAMVRKTLEAFGRLDFAFNNAALVGVPGHVHQLEESDWDEMMGANLKGVWLCMKHQLIQMLKQGGGAIVNNASVVGVTGFELNPFYAASKHGVVGLSKSVALQYVRDGIRVNAICPGLIMTPAVERIQAEAPEIADWLKTIQPAGAAGAAGEVAELVLWLCSEAASFVNGVAMPVDGALLGGIFKAPSSANGNSAKKSD